jgi:phosphoribosylanthranilate isomerase
MMPAPLLCAATLMYIVEYILHSQKSRRGRNVTVRVKICGITRCEDARAAERMGAEAVGVVMYSKSPRSVSYSCADDIFSSLGPFISTVVVSHTTSEKDLDALIDLCPSAIQISHPFEVRDEYRGKVIRVLTPGDPIPSDCSAIAIDESRGTGRPFNSDFARSVVLRSFIPVILCGGLTPDNVADAIQRVRPYAVDVCSGVEKKTGVKDHRAMQRFLEAAGKR